MTKLNACCSAASLRKPGGQLAGTLASKAATRGGVRDAGLAESVDSGACGILGVEELDEEAAEEAGEEGEKERRAS